MANDAYKKEQDLIFQQIEDSALLQEIRDLNLSEKELAKIWRHAKASGQFKSLDEFLSRMVLARRKLRDEK